MSTIVSCPECQRKLKVAPASIGKSVRCTCGKVFKAMAEIAAPPPPTGEMLVVACDGCGIKLKVPMTAQGRKMKCAKCGTVFVVKETPPAHSPAESPPAMFEDEPAPTPRPRKAPVTAPPPILADDDAAILEDEPDEPPARPARKTRPQPVAAEQAAAAQMAPAPRRSGCVLNVIVLLIVLAYLGVLIPMYYEMIDWLPIAKPPSAPALRPIPGTQTAPQNPADVPQENHGKEP